MGGEDNGTPLQYSCLENPMDWGAWWAADHGVAKSWALLSDFTFHFSLLCTGEGNGKPLQYSCLENPRDGGAWWAAIYGVVQSRTWLKRLNSSSSSYWWVELCSPPFYLFGQRLPGTGAYRLLVGLVATSAVSHTMSSPYNCCFKFMSHHSGPQPYHPLKDPPIPASISDPVSYGVTASFPWVLVHMGPCVYPPRVEPVSPSLV